MLRVKAKRLTASRGTTITLKVVVALAAAASPADKTPTMATKIDVPTITRDKTPAKKVINHTSIKIAPTRCTPKSLSTVASGPTTVAVATPVAPAVAVVTVAAEVAAPTRTVVAVVAVETVAMTVEMAVALITTSLVVARALISSREHLRGSRVPRCLRKTFSTPTRRLSNSMRTRWLSSNANVNMCART